MNYRHVAEHRYAVPSRLYSWIAKCDLTLDRSTTRQLMGNTQPVLRVQTRNNWQFNLAVPFRRPTSTSGRAGRPVPTKVMTSPPHALAVIGLTLATLLVITIHSAPGLILAIPPPLFTTTLRLYPSAARFGTVHVSVVEFQDTRLQSPSFPNATVADASSPLPTMVSVLYAVTTRGYTAVMLGVAAAW